MSHTIPSGPSKGTPIEEAQDRDLAYWIANKQKRLAEDPGHRFADSDQAWIDAAQTELERRAIADGGAPHPQDNASPQQSAAQSAQAPDQSAQPPRQPAPRPSPPPRQPPRQTGAIQVVGESISSGSSLMAALQRLSETCTLVAPTTATDSLPEGCAVAISMVKVDPSTDGYQLSGNFRSPSPTDRIGLGKTALERIGAAAGASWIPGMTGRVDDARDPHYCHYQAWVRFQDLDGSFRDYPGECEIDLRDNSPQVLDIIRKATRPDREGNTRDPNVQLAEARKFIQRQCASKAMLVALRRPGLRHWYTREELMTKPFAVTKLIFHGRTQDPALKQIFAKIIADRFSGAARQLFGAVPSTPRHAAPPVGTVPIDTPGEPMDDELPI